MAQGVCWVARSLGVPATVVAPDHAPRAKLDAIARLGGRVVSVPFETWWETMETGTYPGVEGFFVHPVLDERVIAGNGVIGLELAERLDDVDTVLVPWGGGGLTTGIASALAAASPGTRVVACEPETGAPLTASLAAGHPVQVDYTASFVDGAGSKALLPAMWERAGQPRRRVGRAPAGRRRGGDQAARRTRTRGRRRRGCPRPRRGPRGQRGRGSRRVHRVGGEHRPGAARDDPRRRDTARLVRSPRDEAVLVRLVPALGRPHER